MQLALSLSKWGTTTTTISGVPMPGPTWRSATLPSPPGMPGMWPLRCWGRCPRWNWGGSLCTCPGRMKRQGVSRCQKLTCRWHVWKNLKEFGDVRLWFLKHHDNLGHIYFETKWTLYHWPSQTAENAGTRDHHGMADQTMSGRMSSASAAAWMVHPGESHWFCCSKCRRGWRGWRGWVKFTVRAVGDLMNWS